MKKICGVFCALTLMAGGAMASDYKYTETETITTWERVNVGCDAPRFVSSRDVRAVRPCDKHVDAPVRVKTHTEVIEHYQVYQPVTVYRPMGTEIRRHVVPTGGCKHKCKKFAF